ncbi:GGDEF domain-containing protein [Marinobacter salicampi]|uniref:GGDEF domain-containing protein n=1 Tax=Marinobacter salicampi TaxID=435907 RepID=UPI00140AB564|nr:GGDEF domain-containing protein [Marinobacter salicampi]
MRPYENPSLASFTDLLLDAICVVDREGQILFVSAAGERIFGFTPEEMIGRRIFDFVYPPDLAKTLDSASEVLSGESLLHFENRYLRKDGTIAHILWSARWSEADGVRIGVARDISLRKHAESMRTALYAVSEAAHNSADLPSLFERVHQLIESLLPATSCTLAFFEPDTGALVFPYCMGRDGPIARFQGAIAESVCQRVAATGKPLLLGRSDVDGLAGFSCLGVPLELNSEAIGALAVQGDSSAAIYSEQDRDLLKFVGVQLAAAMERKRMQVRLEYMAQHDQLTGLPNRALFLDRFHTALARARRQQTRLGLLFLDLNDFKTVNDTHGHDIGDQLLQAVAARLTSSIRTGDTAGRLGGDEFVVLLDAIEQAGDAALVAEKLLARLGEPYDLARASLTMLPSIGRAEFPEDGADSGALMRHADDAMYRAKQGRC